MKKHILLAAVFIATITLGQAQVTTPPKFMEKFKPSKKQNAPASMAAKTTTISQPGRSINYFWDDSNSLWVLNDTSLYSYNPAGWMSSEITRYNGPNSRSTYTYDAQNRVTNQLYEIWDAFNNAWEGMTRQTVAYDVHDNMTLMTYEMYNTTNSAWEIQFGDKYIYTYNGSGNPTDMIYQSYNNTTMLWENSYRQTAFQYDGSGNLLQYDEQVYNTTTWDNMDRFILTYTNNKPSTAVIQLWSGTSFDDDTRFINLTWHVWAGMNSPLTAISGYTMQTWGTPNSNVWNDASRTTISYDNFGGSVETDQDFTGTNWINSFRYSDFYDNQSNNTGFRSESWNTVSWSTDYEAKLIITYDAGMNITQKIWQYWDSNNNVLVNNEKRVYDNFQVFTGLNEQDFAGLISVYPNPCSSYFDVALVHDPSMKAEGAKLEIYDVSGREILTRDLNVGTTRVQTSALPPSVYIYKVLDAGKALKTGKLLIQ